MKDTLGSSKINQGIYLNNIKYIPLIALTLLSPLTFAQVDNNPVEKRIAAIEKQLAELKKQLSSQHEIIEENTERVDDVETNVSETQEAFDNSFKISSYTDLEYTQTTKNNDLNGVRLHHFSVFLEKQMLPNLKFFSETEYEDAPFFDGATIHNGAIFVEAINLTWKVSQHLKVRGGRFFTPSGIWSENHYPPYVPTQNRPLFIRNIFPQVIDGASAFGQYALGENFINYTLYSGNGEGNNGKGDNNSTKSLGLRTQMTLPAFKNSVIGLDYYQDTLNNGISKKVYGFHGKLNFNNMVIQAEYATGELTNNSTYTNDTLGYYLQGIYNYKDFSFGYRYDFFDKDEAAKVDHKKHNYFVNYHVNSNIILKAEYNANIIENEDNYKGFILSIAAFLR